MAEVSLEMTQTLMGRFMDELRIVRNENGSMRTIMLGLSDQGRRIERRLGEIDRRVGELDRRVGELDRRIGEFDRRLDEAKDDMELMIRSEMMGRLGNFEVRFERRLEELAETISGSPNPPSALP